MTAICLIGDREFVTYDVPPDAKTSDVVIFSVANMETRSVLVMRFVKFKEDGENSYFEMVGAFSLTEEHLESVKRISFE